MNCFQLRLSNPDKLQELRQGHVGKLIFKIFPPFFKNWVECPFKHFQVYKY